MRKVHLVFTTLSIVILITSLLLMTQKLAAPSVNPSAQTSIGTYR